jgi:hypothetical protein
MAAIHSRKKQCTFKQAASGTKTDSKKEQIEEFIRHKQEALGCKRLKAISAAKGSFVLKHTTAVNCQVSVSLSENNVHGDRC